MPVACRPGEKRYKKWAEDVSKIFGGLDIFALNIILVADSFWEAVQ